MIKWQLAVAAGWQLAAGSSSWQLVPIATCGRLTNCYLVHLLLVQYLIYLVPSTVPGTVPGTYQMWQLAPIASVTFQYLVAPGRNNS